MDQFRSAKRLEFELRLVQYVRRYRPNHFESMGESRVNQIVNDGVERASVYGFDKEAQVVRFVLMLFDHSLSFDARYGLRRILESTELSSKEKLNHIGRILLKSEGDKNGGS